MNQIYLSILAVILTFGCARQKTNHPLVILPCKKESRWLECNNQQVMVIVVKVADKNNKLKGYYLGEHAFPKHNTTALYYIIFSKDLGVKSLILSHLGKDMKLPKPTATHKSFDSPMHTYWVAGSQPTGVVRLLDDKRSPLYEFDLTQHSKELQTLPLFWVKPEIAYADLDSLPNAVWSKKVNE